MKIVVIGASYLQLPLVKKCKEMGLETHVFAWEDGAVARSISNYFYPISITEKETILKECLLIKPTGVISIASDLAMNTVNYITSELNLIGNSIESTEVTTNKYKMREKLSEHGVLCPQFLKLETLDKGKIDLVKDEFKCPYIVKPTDRSGSRGVTKVENINDLENAIKRAIGYSLRKECIVEEFVSGDEISVESISYQGIHYVLAITDKETTGSPNFVETAHHQPSIYTTRKKEIEKLVISALDSLEVKNGASHTEIKITKTGELFVIEIGARMGGDFIGSHLVKLSTGYDFVKGVIEVSLGKFTEPNLKNDFYSGVYFLYSKSQGTILTIKDKTGNYPQIMEKEINLKIGDEIKPLTESADRKGYYIYQSKEKFCKSNLIELKIQ
ncbi:ATP-grasp domain-containing protein [bacterium]|nr:ATP-grasp domain-containing protein [bacterium]